MVIRTFALWRPRTLRCLRNSRKRLSDRSVLRAFFMFTQTPVPIPQPLPVSAPVTDPLVESIQRLAEETVDGTDLFVVGVEIRGFQGSRVVQIMLDSDAGAGLDELAEASRRLSFLLDTEDVVKGRYRLDVTSPGADEPLRFPRQFPRNIGRMLEVRYRGEGETDETTTGELTSATDTAITIETDNGEQLDIVHDAIQEARVLLPW